MINNNISAVITGVGSYLPEKILTNADLEKIVDTNDEWIVSRTGIKERHVVGDSGEATAALSTKAAKMALADAGVEPEELDLILLGTVTPDMKTPSSAILVQNNLGAINAAAMDLNAACVGFLYGLRMAEAFIIAGFYKKILLMGAETLSTITNYEDRGTCILFGDGAGAIVIEAKTDTDRGILATHIAADGQYHKLLYTEAGGSKTPITMDNINNGAFGIKMNGTEIFKLAVKRMQASAEIVLEKANRTLADIDLIIPHQANIRIINTLAKRLKAPKDKVYVNIQKYGNTSSASIPIAMTEAKQEGKLKEGDLSLMVSFGGGLVWGAALVRM